MKRTLKSRNWKLGIENWKLGFSILNLIFTFTFTAYSQSLVYENYTVNDGLPGQTVYCAFEDSKGFMWFATDAGVSRFDGVRFRNFTMQDGLSDNEVLSIDEDSHGRIWFLTFNGKLSYLYKDVFHNPSNDSIMNMASGNSSFYAFLEDVNGNLWFSTLDKQVICIQNNNMVSRFDPPEVKDGLRWLSFYQTADNELWIITDHWFYKFDSGEFIPLSGPEIKATDGLPYYYISKGDALFLSSKGLERLINKNFGVIIPAAKIPFREKVVRLYYTSRNDIWITNQKDQTLYYKYDRGKYLPSRSYLMGNSIHYVYTDREENTWFCSTGNGVFKLPAQSFSNRSFTVEDGLIQSHITSVTLDNDSLLWLGFANGIINRITPDKVESFNCNFSDRSYNRIIHILADHDNNIWAATDDGLVLIKRIYLQKYAPPFHVNIENLPAGQAGKKGIYACKSISLDSNTITATWSNGIGQTKYTDLGYVLIPYKVNFPGSRIFTHFTGYKNRVWISTIGGLGYIDKDSLINCAKTDKRLKSRITDIKSTSDNTLVLATYGEGILFFKDGQVTAQVNSAAGLSGSICKKIFITGDTIYVVTDKGLSRFMYNKEVNHRPENFTTSDGLLSNGVNDAIVHNGIIYVATSEGLSMLSVSMNRNLVDPPPLYITSFKVNSTLMDSLINIKLSFDRQHLQFSFVAPTFDHPELLTYQYKLSGLNEEWAETKNNTVEFSALDPGVYVFQLRAKKYNSDWSKSELLKFEITAPFWGTLLFRLITANSLIVILYFVLSNLVSKKYRRQLALYEQQRALQLERNRISTDMHDDLGADLTNIVILAKIASKTINLEGEQKGMIERIGTASNDIINKMNEIIWALNPANDTLSNLVSYLHRYSKEYLDLNNLGISIQIPPFIPDASLKAAYRRNVFLILKESLHNIIKHAEATAVEVNINIDNHKGKFSLTIKDNGKGFSPDERTGSGNGLLNMRKRIKEIKGDVKIESFNGKGTKVNIIAPF